MGISSALGSSALLPAGLGFRNLVINGGMAIDQRYSGSSVTPTATQYVVDRWEYQASVSSKMTVGQNLNSATPPAGFYKYLGVQTGAAANVTVAAGDFYCINHKIEGSNSAQLAWGTASAKPVVLSFWVRSSVTGTHGVSFRNGNATRSYPATYTISAANTWEYKTLQIPGDTSGTWATDNTNGVIISFNLGMGSTYSGPAGAWASANYAAPNSTVKVVETNSATFQITGVQFEQNYQPTPFEQRPIGVELALCQRYYWRYVGQSAGYNRIPSTGGSYSNSAWQGVVAFPTFMRATPSSVEGSGIGCTDNVSFDSTVFSAVTLNTGNSHNGGAFLQCTGASGITNGIGQILILRGGATAYLGLSAEL